MPNARQGGNIEDASGRLTLSENLTVGVDLPLWEARKDPHLGEEGLCDSDCAKMEPCAIMGSGVAALAQVRQPAMIDCSVNRVIWGSSIVRH